MLLSYQTRLRRDLQRWQEIGLIDSSQREHIAANALAAPGTSYLQGVLVLCAVIVAATAVIAFVAANWSGMAPAARMAVLFLADAAMLAGAYVAARRQARLPSTATRAIADGAATLSLAVAAATLALVAQTFHLPPDPVGFAHTIALLGLVTALVTRSGGAALVASIALVIADTGLLDSGAMVGRHDTSPLVWLVGLGLLLGCLSNWLPAKASNLLLLLIVLANHLGATSSSSAWFIVRPERILTIAVVALGIGHVLAALPDGRWTTRFRDGGEALVQAAAGLCLLGILSVSAWTMGWRDVRFGPSFNGAILAIVVSAALIFGVWRQRQDRLPLADLIVLGAAALSLIVLLTGNWTDPASASRGTSTWHLAPFWTVWGGIVPCLALVVAGHITERRALFGWALTAIAVLTIGMLIDSSDLLGFSLNLLGTAVLICLTIALCRWADRRLVARTA